MPRMLKWLEQHPQAGLLHYEQALKGPLSPMIVQYWRSFEDLERFARSPDAPHLAAWKHFNAAVRDSGDVGIWHETYRIAPGASESIFGNMRPWAGCGRRAGARGHDRSHRRQAHRRAQSRRGASGR